MSNPEYLFAGFALAWALAFGYLWMLSRRSAEVQRQIDALEQRVKKAVPDA
jgi:CcmD family protein